MTATDLIEILQMMPPETKLLIPVVGGYVPICPVSCRILEVTKDLGKKEIAFVISTCKCNEKDSFTEGVIVSKQMCLN